MTFEIEISPKVKRQLEQAMFGPHPMSLPVECPEAYFTMQILNHIILDLEKKLVVEDLEELS